MAQASVLEDGIFPIVGWSGPGDALIRSDIMRGMAEAGFTVSHSYVSGGEKEILQALDTAADSGIRLLLVHKDWHVEDNFVFKDVQKRKVRRLINAIKDHPGLYGYHLRDEPRFGLLPLLVEVQNFIRALDSYHLCYINHYPPIEGWGAPSAEAFWRRYIELAQPQLLSYDHYPLTIGTEAEIQALAGAPNVFPQEKLIIKPDYFNTLELLRNLSNGSRIPFWAFTCALRHGPYPTPSEGYIRFQLMNDLAYGAKGLQYFTYVNSMILLDGSTTETWEIAKKVNKDIQALAVALVPLRNIGVFRTGPLWSGTQPLHHNGPKPLVDCEGDAVTIGFFQDAEDRLFVMVVNGNPCSWAKIRLKIYPEGDQDRLYVYQLFDRTFQELWPPDIHDQLVILAPGEGRLFRIGGEGAGMIL